MRSLTPVCALWLLAIGLQARAETESFGATGVWRGTLGGMRVVACIEASGGRYYYETHRTSIEIQVQPGSSEWTEGAYGRPSGTWSDWQVSANELSASWSAADRGRPKLIHLKRVATLRPGENCLDTANLPAAYTGPRTIATQFVESEPKFAPISNQQGHSSGTGSSMRVRSVTGLQQVSLRVFQLEATDPAARRINKVLSAMLDQALQDHYECVSFGAQGELDLEADELAFESSRWLGIRTITRATCGGPYPSVAVGVLTFDRHTGEQVDPIDWVGGNPVGVGLRSRLLRAEFPTATPQLNATEGEDCDTAWANQEYFQAWPSDDGLIFSPSFPHVFQACGDDVRLSVEDLRPYFTESGRRAFSD